MFLGFGDPEDHKSQPTVATPLLPFSAFPLADDNQVDSLLGKTDVT